MQLCSLIVIALLFSLLCTEASPAGQVVQHRTSVWDRQIERLCLRRFIDTVNSLSAFPSHRWWEALRGLSARRPQHMAKAAEDEEHIYEILGSIGACRPATHIPCVQVTPLLLSHQHTVSARLLNSHCFPGCRMPLFRIQSTSASSWPLISKTMRSSCRTSSCSCCSPLQPCTGTLSLSLCTRAAAPISLVRNIWVFSVSELGRPEEGHFLLTTHCSQLTSLCPAAEYLLLLRALLQQMNVPHQIVTGELYHPLSYRKGVHFLSLISDSGLLPASSAPVNVRSRCAAHA